LLFKGTGGTKEVARV